MLQDFKRLFYRDRRRLLFSAVILTFSVLIGPDPFPTPEGSPPLGLIILPVLLFSLPLITLYLPKQRFVIEVLTIAIFLFTILSNVFPNSNFNIGEPGTSIIGANILFLLLVLGVHFLTWGAWSDKFALPGLTVLRSRAVTCLDRRTLWYGMVPTPGQLEACAEPDAVSIDYADRNKRIVRIIMWTPPQKPRETLLHLDELIPFEHTRLRIERRGGEHDWSEDGELALTVVDEADHLRINVRMDMQNIPPRLLVRAWIDDTLGRMTDRRLNAIECKQRNRKVGSATRGMPWRQMDHSLPALPQVPPNGIDRRRPRSMMPQPTDPRQHMR